ncbi:MAG: glycosyltransferase family 39 protein [Candidatus Omnitrophica bacterium]|nr:glycosyltransferase family 39 protein [Candidatus Omnitrophota bacterium]
MANFIALLWVAFILAASVFFSSTALLELVQRKKLKFDKGLFLSLSACLLGLFLCLSIRPAFYRVYHDELAYISQSVNILSRGKPDILLKGSRFRPEALAPFTADAKLPGFAWLNAIALFLTKDFRHSGFVLNLILGTLCIAVMHRIVWSLTSSQIMAWWAAVFLACLPARITYAMSADCDIAGMFFFLLFLLFIIEYQQTISRRIFYASVFCGVYSVCIKPFYAAFVVLILAGALNFYRRQGSLDKKFHSRILVDIFCLFLPVLSALVCILLFYRNASSYWSFLFIPKNIFTSLLYLFDPYQNTLLMTLAALVGMTYGLFKNDLLAQTLSRWFIIALAVLSMFCAGGICYPGQGYSDRYFLPLSIPLIFLAARGVAVFLTMTSSRYFLGGLFGMALVLNAFLASHHLTQEAKDGFHYQKGLILKEVFPYVPNDAYMLDACAAVITTMSSRRAIQTKLFLDGDHPSKIVYLQGIADDLYNSDDPRNMALVKQILHAQYRCRALTASPIREGRLSATPFLCTKK